MKTALKYLTITGFGIAALTWPSLKLKATEVEEEHEATEDIGAREAYRRMQLQDENGEIPPDAWINAYAEKDAMRFLPGAWSEFSTAEQIEAGILGGVWSSIGPGNIGGRIRSIIIHPGSTTPATTIMWAGGVSGGIWKTTNGGDSWTTNTDSLANLAVNCMVMDPSNPNILYAGTGEGFSNNDALRGNGIFKTTDGGVHWTQLPATGNNPNFYFVNRLAISPANPQLLLAATPGGIFRTTDGGVHWVPATGLPSDTWADIRFRPPSIPEPEEIPDDVPRINCLAASVEGRVYYSVDNGASWITNPGNGFPPPAGYRRIELAYSRSQPSIVYASKADADSNLTELFRSVNGGYSFASLGHPQGPFDPLPGAFWYANVLWVDPINPDTVIVGGDYLLISKDRGAHWQEAGTGSHQDVHMILEHPGYDGTTNKTAYSTNDGGVHVTGDILAGSPTPIPGGYVRWTSRNNALGVTQFYGAAGHAASGTIIGGTQDNGTVRFRPSAGPEHWDFMAFGDAGRCAVDQTENPYFYGENLYLQIYRNTHGGGSSGYKSEYIWGGPDNPNGIPGECGGVPCANFTAPFVIDPNLDRENEQKTLLAGGNRLWRTTDARVSDATQVAWAEIKSPITNNERINSIAVAEGDSNLIWVGHNDGSIFYTTNGTASSPTWNPGDPNNLLPGGQPPSDQRFCTRITIAPSPPAEYPQVGRTVYVTFGGFFPSMTDTRGNVWKTQDNGVTWTPIHRNLPSAPVYSLVVSPSNPDILYVGTEVGVFASSNGGQTWSPAFAGSSADTLVYSLVVSASAPSDPDIIYAGTEDGVFASKDGGETWSPGFGGPANTRVEELFWMVTPQARRLVIATHGRGMFTLGPAND